MVKKRISETTIKLRIPKSLLTKWGFSNGDLNEYNGTKINPSKFLRENIMQAIQKPSLRINADLFAADGSGEIEKTIWVPQSLKDQIIEKSKYCTMNSYILAILDSFLSDVQDQSQLATKVSDLERKLNELREEFWFLSVENDLNMKSRFDPAKFFD